MVGLNLPADLDVVALYSGAVRGMVADVEPVLVGVVGLVAKDG